jgi:hypothetical protein
MNSNWPIVALGACLVLVAVVFGLRLLYGYRVRDQAIEVVLFHVLPVYRLPLEDIEQIRKASWSELGVGGRTLRLGNRFARQSVLIQRRSGWIRRIVITPDDPDRFISEVATGGRGHPS